MSIQKYRQLSRYNVPSTIDSVYATVSPLPYARVILSPAMAQRPAELSPNAAAPRLVTLPLS